MGSEFLLPLSRCSSCGGTVEHRRGRRDQQRTDHHLDGRFGLSTGRGEQGVGVTRFTSELTENALNVKEVCRNNKTEADGAG